MADFFTKEISQRYDERNEKLSAIADTMHFLIRLALKDLPPQARILCVGVGTGAEIMSLAKEYPGWQYVGVDPSESMLEVCRERLDKAGLGARCELICGYVQDVPQSAAFDAVLSVLVGHFVKRDEREDFYRHMQQRLKPGGHFIATEISFDLDSEKFPSMLEHWKKVQVLMGATPESLSALAGQLRNTLAVLPPADVETLIEAAGIAAPLQFFQSFMIRGWHGRKG